MIPQNNPLANYLTYQPAIDEAINRVLKSGRYILGQETAVFEEEFADYIGVKHAVSTGTATEALHLTLRAFGIGAGDEVITVSHTAVATVAAIEMCGATPVLVDIEPDTYTINPALVDKAITKSTKVIVPVHLYGQPSHLEPLIAYAKKNNLFVIEDCAQAHGATYHGNKVGSQSDAGVFSFYPTKNLGGLGDGGAITTNNTWLYEKLLALRQYGWNRNRTSHMPGYNSRLDELQAAILRVKLKHLDENNHKRMLVAHAYDQELGLHQLILPPTMPNSVHVYHQYVVRCAKREIRNDLMDFLLKREIQTAIHYPLPVHLQPAYVNRIQTVNWLRITENVCETIVSLPMFPELSAEDVHKVVSAIDDFFRERR
ncbi:MAG: DegT/DnrJ/EryC1/StrS family aminotransferase [Desulfobacteraceae bacterium]|jgi:dTDP-4-amino-4,6-dideoxygalactose transaminase